MKKFLVISRYVLMAAAGLLWFIMMFLPAPVMSLWGFRIFFSVFVMCAVIHSLLRMKYLPDRGKVRSSRVEKIVFAIMIGLLLIRLALF